MNAKKLTLLSILVLLQACASQQINEIPADMRVTDEKGAQGCELKGDVHGVSMFYGVFAEAAMSKSRRQAFDQARTMGANTVVWQPFVTQQGATSVHGNAYLCR